mmetsp:Transcript_104530/g.184414  ORF Transcript_104530/g.184414 Transcript_104530/m.184414 type:complete len:844 (+) Transcript_104530:42-2573(+)
MAEHEQPEVEEEQSIPPALERFKSPTLESFEGDDRESAQGDEDLCTKANSESGEEDLKDMMKKMMAMVSKLSEEMRTMSKMNKNMQAAVKEIDKRLLTISTSAKNSEFQVHYLYASPLQQNRLKIRDEVINLHHSHAIVRLTCATKDNLRVLKDRWTGQEVLHLTVHGVWIRKEYHLVLENPNGTSDFRPFKTILNDIMPENKTFAPKVVVVAACESDCTQEVQERLLERGVEAVVAIRGTILDAAARHFAKRFYHELRYLRAEHGAVHQAFYRAQHDTSLQYPKEAPSIRISSKNMQQLNSGGDSSCNATSYDPSDPDPFLHVGVGFSGMIDGSFSPLLSPRSIHLNRPYENVPEYENQLQQILGWFVQTDKNQKPAQVVTLHGPPGSGKKTLASELVRFATFPGGRFFSGGAIILSPNSVLTQREMKRKFGEKLKTVGIKKEKDGFRFARQAKRGESIPKVEDGEIKCTNIVQDDTSWVIRQESVDRELYVLDAEKFQLHYKMDSGTLISEIDNNPDIPQAERDALQKRGYQRFERQGTVLVYFIRKDDMEEFEGDECEFIAPFSTTPLKFRVGTPLVTPYVENLDDMEDIYVSENAVQIYNLEEEEIMKQESSSAATGRKNKCIPQANLKIPPLTMLKSCIDEEAAKQAQLLDQWYAKPIAKRLHQHDLKRQSSLCNAEHWMSEIPQNTHGLCVLFGGEKYLDDEQCRDYLNDLLQKHNNLCLLITVQTEEAAKHRMGMVDYKEVPVNMTTLGKQSAAKLFHQRVNRKQFVESDLQKEAGETSLELEEVRDKLAQHHWIAECGGRPGLIVEAAELYNSGKKKLTDPLDLEGKGNGEAKVA